jgi:membrane protease YdiL (CAAX protease family)
VIIKAPNGKQCRLFKLPEAIALFFVLFFPISFPAAGSAPITIIANALLWRAPAVILVLLLLGEKPHFRLKIDFLVLAASLPALVLAGFGASYVAAWTGHVPPDTIAPPQGTAGWIAAVLLSFSTGFLEEAYFRVYLPRRLVEFKQDSGSFSVVSSFVISGVIFALCHVYEGPFGVVNAALAAAILSLAYSKSGSFWGIAMAHGLYNCLVFLSAALTQ